MAALTCFDPASINSTILVVARSSHECTEGIGQNDRAAHPPPGISSSRGIRLTRRQAVRDLAHDPNDFLHDVTTGAASSIFQQILNRGADLCSCVVLVYKIPIELI